MAFMAVVMVPMVESRQQGQQVVQVHVIYCGGCGYRSKFDYLAKKLEGQYGDKISVTGEATPGTTGKFEVFVNDVLVHSKANGHGYVDDDAKLKKIINAINAALNQ